MVSTTTTFDVLRSNGAGDLAAEITKNFVGKWQTKDWGTCEIRPDGSYTADGRWGYLAWNLTDPARVQLCSRHNSTPHSYYLRHTAAENGKQCLVMNWTCSDAQEETWKKVS